MNTITIYTDGSYSSNNPDVIGFGCYSDHQTKWKGRIDKEDDILDMLSGNQVGGEISAVTSAIDFAIQHKHEEVIICFDYVGIVNWANGSWKTNRPYTRAYVSYLKQAKRHIKITFKRVSANDVNHLQADELARQVTGAKCQH